MKRKDALLHFEFEWDISDKGVVELSELADFLKLLKLFVLWDGTAVAFALRTQPSWVRI